MIVSPNAKSKNPLPTKPCTVRESARRAAGYDSLKVPARKLQLGAVYLRRIELHGGAPYHLAERLSRFYDCPMKIWL